MSRNLDIETLTRPGGIVPVDIETTAGLVREVLRLRKGIQDYLDGNYLNPRQNRPKPCKHSHLWYQGCDECDEEYFTLLLRGPELTQAQRGSEP